MLAKAAWAIFARATMLRRGKNLLHVGLGSVADVAAAHRFVRLVARSRRFLALRIWLLYPLKLFHVVVRPSIMSAAGSQMTITLNHTIVPARDKEAAARLFAHELMTVPQ